jgi:hypothetical protein
MNKKTETTKIPSVSADEAVIVALKNLTALEQKLEAAIHRPLQAEAEDITERARALLSGKPPKPKIAPDEIRVLKEAVSISLANYEKARQAVAEKIIEGVEPDYKKIRESLLEQAVFFKLSLVMHDSFIQSLWTAGLFDFLPASWSLKAPVARIYPGGTFDELIINLRLPA